MSQEPVKVVDAIWYEVDITDSMGCIGLDYSGEGIDFDTLEEAKKFMEEHNLQSGQAMFLSKLTRQVLKQEIKF